MSTGYHISIGYNSGISCPARLIGDAGKTEAWGILKSVVEKLCGEPDRIIAEARAYGAPECCATGPECCTLQNHADRYKLPWTDRTIYFDEKRQEVIQMASGDRLVKEHIRRAFCRLVMQEMHKHNIEINITVA
jgi:hypothetical protein